MADYGRSRGGRGVTFGSSEEEGEGEESQQPPRPSIAVGAFMSRVAKRQDNYFTPHALRREFSVEIRAGKSQRDSSPGGQGSETRWRIVRHTTSTDWRRAAAGLMHKKEPLTVEEQKEIADLTRGWAEASGGTEAESSEQKPEHRFASVVDAATASAAGKAGVARSRAEADGTGAPAGECSRQRSRSPPLRTTSSARVGMPSRQHSSIARLCKQMS